MMVILASAVSPPPEMTAPACPIRLPGGAVRPAMKPTTGFVMLAFTHSAPRASSVPPISPIMMTPSVSGSASKSRSTSMKSKPWTGSPPMPTAVVWPSPIWVSWSTAS